MRFKNNKQTLWKRRSKKKKKQLWIQNGCFANTFWVIEGRPSDAGASAGASHRTRITEDPLSFRFSAACCVHNREYHFYPIGLGPKNVFSYFFFLYFSLIRFVWISRVLTVFKTLCFADFGLVITVSRVETHYAKWLGISTERKKFFNEYF